MMDTCDLLPWGFFNRVAKRIVNIRFDMDASNTGHRPIRFANVPLPSQLLPSETNNTKSPSSTDFWFCQGRAQTFFSPAVPPCFTERPVRFTEYLYIPDNWRMSYVAEYSAFAFDCALCGPFGRLLFDPALSSPDSLCAHPCLYLRFIGLVD